MRGPIAQTNNDASSLLEKGIPLPVPFLRPVFVVGIPIDFKNEFRIRAEKIGDVGTDGNLTTEFPVHDFAILQPFPQFPLCRIG